MAVVNSKIQWTQNTWNPTSGCTEVSAGCDHCYARTITERFHGKGSFETIVLHEDRLGLPLKWRKPRIIFVNSMSDLFHDGVPDEFIAKVWYSMALAPRHVFQILTKRPGRMASLLSDDRLREMVEDLSLKAKFVGSLSEEDRRTLLSANWPLATVWLGTSVENQRWAHVRIPQLLAAPAALRFVSYEPALGPLDLCNVGGRYPIGVDCLDDDAGLYPSVDWVICGGESGPGARPMDLDWAREVITQCRHARVPVFVKQLGSVWAREQGGDSKGGDMALWPEDLRVREMPQAVADV